MKKLTVVLTSSAVTLAMLGGACPASAASQQLTITAAVVKRASLKIVAQPASVVISAEDIARGYVDVPRSTRVAVTNNSRDGYMLEFAGTGEFIRQITVQGLDAEVQMEPAGGLVTRPGATLAAATDTLTLGFRFILSGSARPGTYTWPLRLGVAPI